MNNALAGLINFTPTPAKKQRKRRVGMLRTSEYQAMDVGKDKADAQERHLPRYHSNYACKHCGDTTRYVANNGCVTCQKRHAKEWNARQKRKALS